MGNWLEMDGWFHLGGWPSSKKARVLIVDEDQKLLDVTSTFLKENGLEVETARSIDAAITLLGGSNFDILLLDFVIGNRRSEEILYFLGISLRRAPHKIIAITAVPELAEECVFQDDISAVLVKPFRLEQLLAEIMKPKT